MFATPSTEMYYLTYEEYKIVSSTPYLEELVQAKCGSSKATEYWEGDAHISTEDPVHVQCTRKIVLEAQRQGAKVYLAKYGNGNEIYPIVTAPEVPPVKPNLEQPVEPPNPSESKNFRQFIGTFMARRCILMAMERRGTCILTFLGSLSRSEASLMVLSFFTAH